MGAFWCGALIVAEIGFFTALTPQHRSPVLETTTTILGLSALALWVTLIWIVRADLLKQYNEREPIGLHLGIAMSITYSFLYFQYHLYKISQLKKRQAESPLANPSRALLP